MRDYDKSFQTHGTMPHSRTAYQFFMSTTDSKKNQPQKRVVISVKEIWFREMI